MNVSHKPFPTKAENTKFFLSELSVFVGVFVGAFFHEGTESTKVFLMNLVSSWENTYIKLNTLFNLACFKPFYLILINSNY